MRKIHEHGEKHFKKKIMNAQRVKRVTPENVLRAESQLIDEMPYRKAVIMLLKICPLPDLENGTGIIICTSTVKMKNKQ